MSPAGAPFGSMVFSISVLLECPLAVTSSEPPAAGKPSCAVKSTPCVRVFTPLKKNAAVATFSLAQAAMAAQPMPRERTTRSSMFVR